MSAYHPTWRHRLAKGLNASVRGNAQAFGFSITVTVSFGVVSLLQPAPGLLDLLWFALAGVLAFSLLNVIVVLALHGGTDRTSGRATLVGTATDFLAVGAGVGAAIGVCHVVDGTAAWVLVPFVAGMVYVLAQSVELTAGRTEESDDSSEQVESEQVESQQVESHQVDKEDR